MKHFVIAALGLLVSLGLSAQDIVGKWSSSAQTASEEGFEIKCTEMFNIAAGGAFSQDVNMDMTVTMDDKDAQVKFRMRISGSGTWEYADSVLTYKFDAKSIASEILEAPKSFPKFVLNMLTKSVVSQMKEQAAKPVHCKVLTLTADSLQVQNPEEKLSVVESFSRVK